MLVLVLICQRRPSVRIGSDYLLGRVASKNIQNLFEAPSIKQQHFFKLTTYNPPHFPTATVFYFNPNTSLIMVCPPKPLSTRALSSELYTPNCLPYHFPNFSLTKPLTVYRPQIHQSPRPPPRPRPRPTHQSRNQNSLRNLPPGI